MMDKKEATKYILLQLCNWYYDLNPSKRESGDNDLSILKSLKLIFFLATIENNNQETLLGDPYKSFKAMPLGPVETDVYDFFKENSYIINYHKTFDREISYNLADHEIKKIDSLINELKKINFDLVNKSAFYLVDLTHEWDCWKNSFSVAERNGSSSEDMKIEEIIRSNRYYSY